MHRPAEAAGSPRRSPDVVRGRQRAAAMVAVIATLAFLLDACTVTSDGPGSGRPFTSPPSSRGTTSSAATRPQGCTLSAKAVPSCGVLWGIATHPPTPARLRAAEQAIGRRVDFVYRYHDINDVVPDAAERKWVAQGKLLHISIAARDFASTSRSGVTWAKVASGRYDAQLTRQAKGIASLRVPVFMTFEQEANQTQKVAVLGTPRDFVAAWRHIHDLYAKAGVTNAVWTWVMTGNAANLLNAGRMWPGNRYVDWISWNVYNFSGCHTNEISLAHYVSFRSRFLIFYRWMKAENELLGMDTSKPIMISETGSAQYAGHLGATARWYAAIPAVLKHYPQVKAVGLWDSADGYCNFDFTDKPKIAAGVRRAGLDPYVALHGALAHAR